MKTIISALALSMALTATAQTDILKIELNDGSVQTIAIDDIKQMTFDTEESSVAGSYNGTVSVTVGGMWTYSADNDAVNVTVNADGTIDVTLSEYHLTGTMMGDLTLGALTVKNISYDETKKAYYRNYSNDGLSRHFTAVSDGQTTMDNNYPLGETSEITLKFDGNKVELKNDFKLGAMPFALSSSYTGSK